MDKSSRLAQLRNDVLFIAVILVMGVGFSAFAFSSTARDQQQEVQQ